MNAYKHMSQVFETSKEVPFDNSSKIVLISDCHRGQGDSADDFLKNQHIYFAALTHYYDKGYTYIEIGDGDELWENRSFTEIQNVHSDAFWLLSRFYKEDRLYMLYGNHDMVKKDKKYVRENLFRYYDERTKRYYPLFKDITVYEGLVLRYSVSGDKIFLIHGHQVDPLNSRYWKLARFLVKHLWRPLETRGVNDPTSTAQNYQRKDKVEKRLTEWVIHESQMLIAGHTHRPMFPDVGAPPYFNDGSCVHPRCITAIEIAFGQIRLVKWSMKTREDGTLVIGRDVLAGPEYLANYFRALSGDRGNQS